MTELLTFAPDVATLARHALNRELLLDMPEREALLPSDDYRAVVFARQYGIVPLINLSKG